MSDPAINYKPHPALSYATYAETAECAEHERSDKITFIVLGAIAIIGLIYAQIAYGTVTALLGAMVANPIASAVILGVALLVIAGCIYYNRDVSMTVEGVQQSGENVVQIKEMTLQQKLELMKAPMESAPLNALDKRRKIDYLYVLGQVNVDEFIKMPPTKKKEFMDEYSMGVVWKWDALISDSPREGEYRMRQKEAKQMHDDLSEYYHAEISHYRAKDGFKKGDIQACMNSLGIYQDKGWEGSSALSKEFMDERPLMSRTSPLHLRSVSAEI